ncbi:2-oxoglutarate dehydrogenase complex dihydrolipoyllysine-residue succinyltransferase [Candidatus Thiosymbion oneisti]|uniref:2-oxoglutarate dehydrogenase complex dihydrolipoyllysine-residue succinyltransferase n=1 Tax=Candidatus Thiosymbion oneisti TaxID=589554 RepID=UPI000AC6A513|nr:2-oxoglutarate dehydrogenase complex dihydrolipoyllysine-residue succinyltransferase [Candidatus Thiosymbion oneisti]
MSTEVRVPALPESIADATVLAWYKQPGETVRREENLVDLETDKVVLEVPAPIAGVLGEIKVAAGETVQADTLLALIEAGAEAGAEADAKAGIETGAVTEPASSPAAAEAAAAATPTEPVLAPAARRLVKALHLDPAEIPGSGKDGRVQKADVTAFLDAQKREQAQAQPPTEPDATAPAPLSTADQPRLTGEAGRPEQRVPMTRLRARVAERLVQAQQTAAILTTFNEVDLSAVIALRKRYQDQFEKTHGVRLGFMSFFVKAVVEALQRFPVMNASVDGKDIIYHGYYDIGMAVSSPRGLVVPILRNCDRLTMADIEQGILEFGRKAKDGTLSYEELTGGTFSITNGGVFGSLLSTPILNPPQSAILGLHRIQDRPMAAQGELVIRPMMYLALSYDHRLIDGRDAVQFLVTIKDTLEDPARLLLRI